MAQSPAPAPSPTISGEFELKLDSATYDVSEGQPFEVKLASGEKVSATLSRKKARIYQGDGLTLEFSPEFKLTREPDGDLTTLTFDHARSPLAILQIFPPEVKPEEVPKELLDGIKKEFKDKKATVVKDAYAVQREFKGAGKVTGAGLLYSIGAQQIEVEAFSWPVGNKTVAITLQWASDEADLAKQVLAPLASSIAAR